LVRHLAIGPPRSLAGVEVAAWSRTPSASRHISTGRVVELERRTVQRTEMRMGSTESEVKALFDSQLDAIQAKDLDRLMAVYSPDIVYFDAVPPLQYAGSAALRSRFSEWFGGFQGPIGMEMRDLNISTSGEIAVAHWLSRASGTLTNGREVGSWVRATSCCQRSNHRWLITHEHISLPVDFATGRAATDLLP
jgi:ketosteroid isomerase-like protein